MANTKITTNVIADDAVTSDKLGGDLTMPGHVSLADNKELRIGTGNDLVIKHDGSHTTLTNTTGNFTLLGDAVYIGNAANNEYLAQFIANGAASLRYDNTEELATVSGGVYVPNKLGIGTNSASSELHVKGSGEVQVYIDAATNNNPGVRFLENGANKWTIGNDNTNDGFFFYDFGASAERMRIDGAGRVLIGTTASRLTSGVTPNFVIEGTSYNTNSIGVFTNANGVLDCPAMFFGKSRGTSLGSNTIVQNGDRLFSMRIDGSDGANLEQAVVIEAHVDAAPATNSIPGRLTFMTTNSGSQYATEKMRIDNTGITTFKPGIGDLSIKSNDSSPQSGIILEGIDANHAIYLRRGRDGTLNTMDFHEYSTFRFWNGGAIGSQTMKLYITSTGFTKHAAGSFYSLASNYHELNTNQTSSWNTVMAQPSGSGSNYGLFIANQNDNTDTTSMYISGYTDGAYRFKIFSNGNIQNTNNSYGAISDEKLKQDIEDASSQWDDVKNLRVRKFRWKKDPELGSQLGLIAQEAETVSPGLIEESDEGNSDDPTDMTPSGETTKSLKYSVLYMKAFKALQEAMDRIETLEAEVKTLKEA